MNITHYLVRESSTAPSVGDPGWIAVTPAANITVSNSFTVTAGNGTKHVYAWVKDEVGNVSAVSASSHLDVVYDTVAPIVSSFTSSSTFPTSSAFAFNLQGTDGIGIVAYAVSELPTPPSSGWTSIPSNISINVNGTYTPLVSGVRNLYAWLKDGAGNVSVLNSNSYLSFAFGKNPWDGVLIRDTFTDTSGNVPVTDPLYMSPDIIPWGTTISANPSADFPDYASGYWHSTVKNQQNYFYVRSKNLGTHLNAGQATAYLYWTDPSLFNSPSSWINNALTVNGAPGQKANPLPDMANGAIGITQTPFIWTPNVTGHYCMFAIVSTDRYPWDPVNPLKFASAIDFSLMVQYSPNICWKNLDVEATTTFKNVYTRTDNLNNEWKDDLPVMVGVTVRKVPVGTIVEIVNENLGIKVKQTVEKADQVIYTPGAILKGGAKTGVKTTITLPVNARFNEGIQIETAAYAGVRSRQLVKSGNTINLGRAIELPEVEQAVKLTQKLAVRRDVGSDEPVGFIRLGVCTTVFSDSVGRLPALSTKPVAVILQKPVLHGGTVINKPEKPILGRMTDMVKKAFTKNKKKDQKAVPRKPSPVKAKPAAVEKGKSTVTKKAKAPVKKAPAKKPAVKKTAKAAKPVKTRPVIASKKKPLLKKTAPKKTGVSLKVKIIAKKTVKPVKKVAKKITVRSIHELSRAKKPVVKKAVKPTKKTVKKTAPKKKK
jgi:hypothetical protein